jgi:hypothetical protein
MEKCTIPSGYIAAHGHSGLPSLNPARWPSRWPLASMREAARGSMAWQRVIGDEVFGTAIHTTSATRRYTHTLTATVRKGSSLKQR